MACPNLFGPAGKAFKLLSDRRHQKTAFNDSGAVVRLHKWTTAGRVYSGFICAAAFGLALAALLSCISPTTTELHLFSMRTLPLKGLSTNSVLNGTSKDGVGVNLYRRDTATNISYGIPDEYLLGISGVCRIYYSASNATTTTTCSKSLFHENDILSLIRADSGTRALGPSIYDTSVEQFRWNAIAKSGSVLLIVATVCTAALAFLVQFDFLPFWALAILMALNAFFAFASASLWTTMVVNQAFSYSALIAPTATDAGHAAAFGAGFYVIWVYFLCTLALTPLMLQFTSLMIAQALVQDRKSVV